MRVLLADVQPLVRRGLISVLNDAFPQWSFRHAGDLFQAVEPLDTDDLYMDLDLIITDLDLPGMNGGAGLQSLRKSHLAARIVVLANAEDWDTIVRCLAAGVHGYLPRRDASEQLTPAVRTVLSGGVYLPPQLPGCARGIGAPPAMPATSVMASLTSRQQQVLTLLVDGQSTKDIARSLNLGLGTVKIHLGCIYRTLGARNRADVIRLFRGA